MGDMREVFDAMRQHDKTRRMKNLSGFDSSGWVQHSEYHYSRDLLGDKLDYWPSRKKFRWRGKTMTGDVAGFINNRIV